MHDRTGTAYIQVRPHHLYNHELRAIKLTQRSPDVIEPGCVVIKVQIQVPDSAFRPLEPEATIVVPEGLVHRPVTVEAVEAEEET